MGSADKDLKNADWPRMIVCWTRCYACQFDQCPVPHGPHTWGAQDDFDHAAATGQTPPGICACSCARAVTPEQEAALAAWAAAVAKETEKRLREPAKLDDMEALAKRLRDLAAPVIRKTRVEIDPNIRVRGNQTRTGLKHVHGPIAVGFEVTVYESESGIEGVGTITDINHAKRLVWLAVDWASLQPKEEATDA